jgi:hypothetical protein
LFGTDLHFFFFWVGGWGSLVLSSGLSWGYFKAAMLMGLGQVKELCQMKGWIYIYIYFYIFIFLYIFFFFFLK